MDIILLVSLFLQFHIVSSNYLLTETGKPSDRYTCGYTSVYLLVLQPLGLASFELFNLFIVERGWTRYKSIHKVDASVCLYHRFNTTAYVGVYTARSIIECSTIFSKQANNHTIDFAYIRGNWEKNCILLRREELQPCSSDNSSLYQISDVYSLQKTFSLQNMTEVAQGK